MQTRRTFVAAASALTLATAGSNRVVAAGPAPYDFGAIDARLNLAFRHRQVFGTHRLGDGQITGFMLNSLNAYEFDYGDGPGSLHALGVLYGTAVALLLDDQAWRTYKVDVVQQRRGDPARANAAGGNPYARATSALDPAAARSDSHGLYHDASLAALSNRKASFFACDNALRGLATDIAVGYQTSDLPLETVHEDLRRHLVPGTLLVPAGVAAMNQAQEAKFTLFPAG